MPNYGGAVSEFGGGPVSGTCRWSRKRAQRRVVAIVAYSDHFPSSASISADRTAIADALLKPASIYNLIVRHYRRIEMIAIVAFVMLASLILLMAPRYSGTAIVLVDTRQQSVLQSDAVLSGIGNDIAAVDSQVEVIQSAPIADRAARALACSRLFQTK